MLTQRPFLMNELQLWEDGVATTSRHLYTIDGAARASTRLPRQFRDGVGATQVRGRVREVSDVGAA